MEITPMQQFLALVHRSQKVLVLGGSKPSEDTVAAVLALQMTLSRSGKEVTAVLADGTPKTLEWLKGVSTLQKALHGGGDFVISVSTNRVKVQNVKYTMGADSVDIVLQPKDGKLRPEDVTFGGNVEHFDLIVVVGCNCLEDLGGVFEENPELFVTAPVVNLSVNPANTYFGKVNVTDPMASSVCELLWRGLNQVEELKETVDADLATILLCGVIAGTGSFLGSGTSAGAMEAAAQLQDLGAQHSDIIEHLYKRKSLATLKAWGRALGALQVDEVHHFCWTAVTGADLELADASPDEMGDIATNLLRFVRGVDLVVMLVEDGEDIKIQVRVSAPGLDTTALAKTLEGEVVRNGVDIKIADKTVGEVEAALLGQVLEFQKVRHNVPADVGLQKLRLTPTQPKPKAGQNATPAAPVVAVTATPPAAVPFLVGEQQQEEPPEDKISQALSESLIPPGTASAEVTLNPQDKNVPGWLRKNLPRGQ